MSIKANLFALIARDPFFAHILMLLVRGQNDLVRFPPFEYYTIPFEGEELIFGDELRADIEKAIGQPLVEGPAIGNLGTKTILRLFAPLALKADIEAVLLQHESNSPSADS